jgi:hypothetical protein
LTPVSASADLIELFFAMRAWRRAVDTSHQLSIHSNGGRATFGVLMFSLLMFSLWMACDDESSSQPGEDAGTDASPDGAALDTVEDLPTFDMTDDRASDGDNGQVVDSPDSPDADVDDSSDDSPDSDVPGAAVQTGVALTSGGGWRQSDSYFLWVVAAPPAPVALRESTHYRVTLGPPHPSAE